MFVVLRIDPESRYHNVVETFGPFNSADEARRWVDRVKESRPGYEWEITWVTPVEKCEETQG